MEAKSEENGKFQSDKPRPSRRKLKWILLGLVCLLLLALLATPMLLSSQQGRKLILAKLNRAIPGKTGFGDLSIGWFKGITVKDLTYNDRKGRLYIAVKNLVTKPRYAALLAGRLRLGKTTIDQPTVHFKIKPASALAAGTVQPAPVPSPPPKFSALAMLSELLINDGTVKITEADRTVELSDIDSTVVLNPPPKQSHLTVSLSVPGQARDGRVRAEAQISPAKTANRWSLQGTSAALRLDVNNVELGSLQALFDLVGLPLQANGTVSAKINGQIEDGRLNQLRANIKGTDLELALASLKGDKLHTSALEADVELQRRQQEIAVKQLHLQSDWAELRFSGTVPSSVDSWGELLRPESPYSLEGTFDCNLAEVVSQLPNTLAIKKNATITTGRLRGKLQKQTTPTSTVISANAELTDFKGSIDQKAVSFSEPVKATVEISADKEATRIKQLQLTASFAQLSCSGTLAQLNYKGQLDLTKLRSELGQFVDFGSYRFSGLVAMQGQASTKDSDTTVVGSALGRDLRLARDEGPAFAEPNLALAYSVLFDRKNQQLKISSASATAVFGRVSVRDGVYRLSSKAPRELSLPISAAELDLAKVSSLAGVFNLLSDRIQFAGLAQGDVSITAVDNIYTIKTDNLNLKNFELRSPEKQPFRQQQVLLRADLDVDPAHKATTIRMLQIHGDQIKLDLLSTTVSSDNSKNSLQGKAQVRYDWSALRLFAADKLPKDLTITGSRKTSLEFSTKYPADEPGKLLANLTTSKCKLGFDELRYKGLQLGPVDANAQFQNGVLTIEPLTTTLNSGRIHLAARADFKQEPPILSFYEPLTIENASLNQVLAANLLSYLNPIFANAVDLTGVANFTAERLKIPLSSAAKTQIDLAGTFSVPKLRLRGAGLLTQICMVLGSRDPTVSLIVHPTRFTVKDQQVKYDNMQIDIGDNPVTFKGVIGLDKQLDMSVSLPYTVTGKTIRIGKQAPARPVTLSLKGTVTEPQLDAESLLQDQLQGLFEGLLDKLNR